VRAMLGADDPHPFHSQVWLVGAGVLVFVAKTRSPKRWIVDGGRDADQSSSARATCLARSGWR
jgi:hypothetical protein